MSENNPIGCQKIKNGSHCSATKVGKDISARHCPEPGDELDQQIHDTDDDQETKTRREIIMQKPMPVCPSGLFSPIPPDPMMVDTVIAVDGYIKADKWSKETQIHFIGCKIFQEKVYSGIYAEPGYPYKQKFQEPP